MATFTTLRELNVSVEEIQTQETPRQVGEFRLFNYGREVAVFEYVGLDERKFALVNALTSAAGLI
jgi:hypothetical protein